MNSVLEILQEPMGSPLVLGPVNPGEYFEGNSLGSVPLNRRLSASLALFLEVWEEAGVAHDKIDRALIDTLVGHLDQKLSCQLNEIMHHPEFQEIESIWRSLDFLVNRSSGSPNTKIEILDCSKEDLRESFEDSPEVSLSALYHLVYSDEYDTPGGEPLAAVIGNYEFDASEQDVELLQNLSQVSAAAHCPFLASAGAGFFGKKSMEELVGIEDLQSYMGRAEYHRWHQFRQSDDSRYVGLTLPRFLLRLPWGKHASRVPGFAFEEDVQSTDASRYLWGNAVFAFAANMVESFTENGWCVQIRGPHGGGRVDQLPLHSFDEGRGWQMRIPTEILISESREFAFAQEGFIPLSCYKNQDHACFFSASSARKPMISEDQQTTANSRINTMLPYIFLVSRLAHYLKVLQRENIGAAKDASVLDQELNSWIRTLVTEMENPGADLIARHPLRYGRVEVREAEDWPGFFRVSLEVVPHFQVEGVDVNLSLVSKLPQQAA